jgi:hypothetical protein
MFGLSNDCPVAAIGVAVKFFDGLYDVRTKGIQVYVADQGKEIVVFVAEYGFVAVLEQMSAALVAAVVVLGVPGKLFSHDGGDPVLAALKKNMYMVVHEDPGIDGTFSLYYILSEAFQKARLVFIVVEYAGFIDSPHHDMVQSSRYVQSRLAWHEMIVLKR